MRPSPPQFNVRTELQNLQFSPTLGINQRVKALRADGIEVAHLGFGESPFPVHPILRQALEANSDKSLYLPTTGHPDLRSLVPPYFGDKLGFEGESFQAIIGPGSKELIYNIQLAVEGDLLLPVPSWVSYAPQADLTGDQVIKIKTRSAEKYHITPEDLADAILKARVSGGNPRKLVLNYPNNPTGLSLNPTRLEQIAQVCRDYGILVISDEIYALIDHRGTHTSIARYYPEGTIVTSGLSKHLSLGGYRLGVALIPKALDQVFETLVRIASETWSTVSAPIQYTAIKAFEGHPVIESYIHTCTSIHKLVTGYLHDVLLEIGIPYPAPDGAFYLYPDFEPFREVLNTRGVHTSEDLARYLLEEIRVAALPGTAFGDDPNNLYLRLAACDYNGGEALDYFQRNPGCSPQSLVESCCPNIYLAGQRLLQSTA